MAADKHREPKATYGAPTNDNARQSISNQTEQEQNNRKQQRVKKHWRGATTWRALLLLLRPALYVSEGGEKADPAPRKIKKGRGVARLLPNLSRGKAGRERGVHVDGGGGQGGDDD